LCQSWSGPEREYQFAIDLCPRTGQDRLEHFRAVFAFVCAIPLIDDHVLEHIHGLRSRGDYGDAGGNIRMIAEPVGAQGYESGIASFKDLKRLFGCEVFDNSNLNPDRLFSEDLGQTVPMTRAVVPK
jgi:hypothetical protein